MQTIIRHEQEQEYFLTENTAREAFWNLYFPGCHEHYVIHAMRTHKDFIPELSFVMEHKNEIIGGIFFTHSAVIPQNADLPPIPTVSFGPVFIAPKFHRQGLGRKLITHAIEKAAKAGHRAVLTLGFPYHYAPYGFTGGKKYGICMEDGRFYQGLLALPLQKHALDGISGHVRFSDVFEVNAQKAEEFDKNFPHKEKLILPCQAEYEKACTLLDETDY